MDEWPVEEASDGLRRSRAAAVMSLILVLTSLWLPWWVVRYLDAAGQEYARDTAGLFSPLQPMTHPWLPHLSGALVAVAAGWLFVRLAGRSWLYEPPAWRRDLALVGALLLAALLSVLLWPRDVPHFWGHRRFSLLNATGSDSFTEQAMAGLGWWCAAAAVAVLAVAWWLARDR